LKARTVLVACTILCGLVAALLLPAVVRADAGLRDGPYTAGTSGSPTTSKPESKLWWNDGFWWAVMAKKVTPTNNDYHIFRLNYRSQRWRDTGVEVDARDSTRQDVLSKGNKLLIASHKYVNVSHNNPAPVNDEMRLSRFTYHAGSNTYTSDGAPATIDTQKSETLVIDADSTGVVWATWVQESGGQHQVYVKRSDGDCVGGALSNCDFGANPTVTLDPTVSQDDISSVVSFGGNKIGVMWSDTSDPTNGQMQFAVHNDGDAVGAWSTETAIQGRKMADDHINLKADSHGRVYAATKTKFSGQASPGTMLLRRAANGAWSDFTVSRASLGHTRPIVLLDEQHNRVRVFEGSTHNTAIYLKTSRLGKISFPVLKAGARVIQDTGSQIANATSTKQEITNSTRLIVLATNPATKRYWHAYFQIIPCIRGNAGHNKLIGTRGNDALCGLGGNDTLKGLAGKDRLVGGSGNDTIISRDKFRDVDVGGPGHDRARVDSRDVRRSIEKTF
jgi:Ca2+-binding RTX toxin-like protein